MMKNDLGATSGERWCRAAATEAADFSQEHRRSRCIRLSYWHFVLHFHTVKLIELVIRIHYYTKVGHYYHNDLHIYVFYSMLNYAMKLLKCRCNLFDYLHCGTKPHGQNQNLNIRSLLHLDCLL